ncbi:MAG: sigma-70 family RNA polymerase sigma factor, partial [Planctomycetota bacterium]
MADVWELYRQDRPVDVRNFLMEKFLHLVRFNAERIYARLPDEVDVEDLMSAGLFGLMDAVDGFDPARGVKFETYCAQRIRGAILDELRSMDWVPRLVRHRTARVDEARRQLEASSGRKATDSEVAKKLNIDQAEFEKYIRDSDAKSVTSLSRSFFPSDGNRDLREIDVIRDDSQPNPVGETQRRDLKDLITKGLSRAERFGF